MGVARVVIIVLVSHLIYLQSGYTQNVCNKGWFGSSCQYKCRCVNDKCEANGTCTPGSKCQKGWFGPACQYENIVTLDTSSRASHLITDRNDTTCNDVKQLSNMTTTWPETYVFSWLRLRVSQPDVFHQISVSITNNGSGSTCADLALVVIDKQTLDIHCPSSVLMNKLELTGDGVKNLCSLYVSGGRNVAIKQTTNQSSTYADTRNPLSYTKSENAVDGNPSGRFDYQTCTHTKDESHPTWNVFLTASKLVSRYVIYNRDTNKGRLQGFVLESFDNSGKMVFQYNNSSKTQDIYQIIDSDIGHQVVQVQIYLNKTEILTLCEVELYGDSVCPHGYYGRDCEYTCNCDVKSERCFVSTGGCPSGCPPGFYGEGCRKAPACSVGYYGALCDRPCPQQCQGHICNKESGFCTGCEPGWRGLTCDKACDTGRFGKGCTQMCSYQCAKVACGAADGVCVEGCRQGYKPPYCNEECDPGFHGFNCTETCSKNCHGSKNCDKTDGVCLDGCIPGYKGRQCETECNVGSYGVNCQQQCSPSCLNTDCDHVTGVCKKCQPGKRGDQCAEDCSVGTYGMKCVNICSQNCQGAEGCDSRSGECKSGCKIGYLGAMCDKPCENMTYGEGCKSNCSQFCTVDVNQQNQPVCHHISGACSLGCINDYEGLTCEQAKLTDTGMPSGAIAGPIVAVLVLVILLMVGMFVWRRRKRTKYNNGMVSGSRAVSASQRNSTSSNGPNLVLDKPSSYTNTCDLTTNGKNNDGIYSNMVSEPPKTTIAVGELSNFMLSHSKDYFAEQFKKIPMSSNTSMAVGMSAENKNKNRYKNICAYDHSRVMLIADSGKGHGDYINASYIQGYDKKETFIASQGPSKVILEDFVRLLWEQKSDIVVMLTNLVEDGKQKCEQYWPEINDLILDEIKVTLMSSQVLADCVIRKLQLKKESQAPHIVTQYHFTSWPDKSVPITPWSLVDFQQRIFSHPTSKSIVVHCSAGVGRTGTFIALRNVIEEAQDTGYMDFYTTLWKLREDRINMIQTVEQYIFLHEAALVAMACLGTTVTSSDVKQRIDALEETAASGETNMEKEFKAVCNLCTSNSNGSDEEGSGGSVSSTYTNSRTIVNKVKNRFSNVLPKDYYRPHLFCETKDMGEYINAVLLSSFTSQYSQIITQLPLSTTVLDFWRLVTQYNVSLIVVNELDSDDSTVGAYVPSESGVLLQCGPFEIKITSKKSSALWEEKVLFVVKQKKRKPSLTPSSPRTQEHQVTHLKCAKSDLDPNNLLPLIQQIRSYKANEKTRVLFMCRNGALYSGLVCILKLLLDAMDNDAQVMVPLAVGSVKTIRPQVIPTLDQYRTLYQVLDVYCSTNNTYSNFADIKTSREATNETGIANAAFEDNENNRDNVYANF